MIHSKPILRTLATFGCLMLAQTLVCSAALVFYVDEQGELFGFDRTNATDEVSALQALATVPSVYELNKGFLLSSGVLPDTRVLALKTEADTTTVTFSTDIIGGELDEARLTMVLKQVRATLWQFGVNGSIRMETEEGRLLSSYLPPVEPVEPGPTPKVTPPTKKAGKSLGGRNICIGPSHGRFWNGSGWYWQRSDPCGFGEAVLEDCNSIRLAQFLYQYLTQDGATVHVPRELNESNCCNGYEGLPWWKMAAYSWLRANGLPCSVWANSSGNCGAENAVGRSSDDIRARPLFADYRGSEIYIAMHSNAGGAGTANGTETFRDTAMEHPAHETASYNLALAVNENVVSAIRSTYPGESAWSNRGVKDSNGGFGEIRIPNRPACLIELAFHDNCSRDALYLTDNFFRSVAEWGLYKGICEYFGQTPTWDKYSDEYVSDTIPTTMTAGQSYNVSVTFRNRGVVWSEARAFRLGANGDSDPFTATTRHTISGEVRPGNTYTFSFTMTAPTTPGVYTTDWRMVRDSYAWFGATLSKSVTVTGGGGGGCTAGSDNNRGTTIGSYSNDSGEQNPSHNMSGGTSCSRSYWYCWDHYAGCGTRGFYARWNHGFSWSGRGWYHEQFWRPGYYSGSASYALIRAYNTAGGNNGNTWRDRSNCSTGCDWLTLYDQDVSDLANYNGVHVEADESQNSCKPCGSAITMAGQVRGYGARWHYINDWVCLGGYSGDINANNTDWNESDIYLYPALDTSHGNVFAYGSSKVPGRVTTGDCNNANTLNIYTGGNAAAYGAVPGCTYAFAWMYSPGGAGPKFLIGADDNSKTWVNGTLINNNQTSCCSRDSYETGGIGLSPGWSRVLFKIYNGGGPGFGTISLRNGGNRHLNEPSVNVFTIGGAYSYGVAFEQDWWYPCLDVANFYGSSNPQPDNNYYGNTTTVTASGTASGNGPVPFSKVMHYEWGCGIAEGNYANVSSSGTSWSHTQTGVTGHRRFHFFSVSQSGRTSRQTSGVSGGNAWDDSGHGNYMDVYVDNVAPQNPSFSSVTPGTAQINLGWTIPLDQGVGTSPGATEYPASMAPADEKSTNDQWYRRGDVGVQVYRDGSGIYGWGTGLSVNDTGLTPNNPYTYKIEARDNTSQGRGAWANTTGQQASTVVWTLSVPPVAGSVTPDNLSPCAGSTVTWTAADGFGAGSVAKYKYAWDQSPTHTWTGAEPEWSEDTIATIPTAAGTWYLHLKGYNGANVENGTYAYAVTALAAPTTTGIAGSATVAIGQVAQVYAVTPAPASGSSFVWGVPSDATITAGGSGPDNSQITVTFGSASGNVTVTEKTAGNCVGAPVVLGVTVGPNHAPVAAGVKSISTPRNTAASIYKVKLLAGATDADSDPLSISAAGPGSAQGGAVVVQANDVKYTPLTDFFGSDSFTYTISDGQGGTAVGTVNVTVTYGGGLSPNLVYWPTYDGSMFRVTFAGIPGYEYGVEWSEAPSGGPWTWLKNATAGANGLFEVTDVVSGTPARYYRIVYPPSNP